jgi:hypothetical protein
MVRMVSSAFFKGKSKGNGVIHSLRPSITPFQIL